MDAMAFERMAFQYPFRRYQRLALSWVDAVLGTEDDDGRFHLVAPPGSGKTILGLELVRRLGRPAVVFAPTSAIQQQWATQVDMFLPEGTRDALVSTDPARLAPITVLTYQVVSTTAAADEPLDVLARERWCQELVDARQVADPEAAVQRLDTLQANNPRGYARELARRHRRVKRDLLRSGEADILRFLHPNAVELLDRLAAAGVGTVVLDECHHLLDHWAVVLRTLIGRLDQPRVIGLTATLPDPDTPEEHENYDALLGPVDIQVPTPAVVKEGELAPYRDLVWFVEPTPGERRYLDDIQLSFEHALQEVTGDPRFRDWLTASLGADDPERWMQALRDDPVWATAGMRVLHALGLPASEHLTIPVQAEDPPTPSDRAQVVGRYGLTELKMSADPVDHDRLAHLRRVLQPFGFVLGEQGIRQSRSPGDLVVSYSESKQAAVAEILAQEHAALGDRLRAIVVTDFERAGRRIAHAGGALPADAGSARHTFRTLLADPALRDLDPVLLTGSTLWVDADIADTMVADLNGRLQDKGLSTRCEATRFDGWRGAEIRAAGGTWSTRIYVRLVTELFEAGLTQCIVGTRGLLGEGWDALRLNTLVDLTSVTTAQSVQQLRGRSIRLDPSWPAKVAHNWDVICVAPAFDRGDRDLRRFTARHRHLWGATPVSRLQERVNDAIAGAIALTDPGAILPTAVARGDIVRGVGHVDPDLAHQLAWREWKDVDVAAATRRSAAAIGDRADSHDLWGIGDPYANDDRWIARINPVDLRIRTAHTVEDTLRALLRTLRSTLLGAAALLAWLVVRYGLQTGGQGLTVVIGVSLAMVTALLAVRAGPLAWQILRELVAGQPRDHVIGDIGHAVLEGLRDAGLVSSVLLPEHVRVAPQPDGTIDVLLEHAPQDDAEVFVEAMAQVLGPIEDPRYLILRDDRRLAGVGLRWLWVPLRQFVAREGHLRPDHHPVPDLLGVNRSRADAFAATWQRHVGGGELVYTRSDDGWRVLLEARSRDRPTAPTWAFERWS